MRGRAADVRCAHKCELLIACARLASSLSLSLWLSLPLDATAVAVSTGLLGGVAGAVVAFLAALVIGFVVYRSTMVKRQKKMMEDYISLQIIKKNLLKDLRKVKLQEMLEKE